MRNPGAERRALLEDSASSGRACACPTCSTTATRSSTRSILLGLEASSPRRQRHLPSRPLRDGRRTRTPRTGGESPRSSTCKEGETDPPRRLFCAKNGWAITALGGFGLPPTRSEGTRVFGGTGSRRERTQHEAAIPSRDVWGGADGRTPVQGGGSPNRDAPVVRPLEPTIPSRGSANGLVFHPRTIGKRSLGPVAA